MSITREEFYDICNQAIHETRERVKISNQLSGYKDFHKEIKINKYVHANREHSRIHEQKTGAYSLAYQHSLIKRAGLGKCYELTEYLAFEILEKLKSCNVVDANVKIAVSNSIDHAYLHIEITLQDEITSLWEVDAWDPRILDITEINRRNKNSEWMDYGKRVKYHFSFKPNEINLSNTTLFLFKKPQRGDPERESTPPQEMLQRNRKWLYSDHTIDEAIQKGKMLPIKRKFVDEKNEKTVNKRPKLNPEYWQMEAAYESVSQSVRNNSIVNGK